MPCRHTSLVEWGSRLDLEEGTIHQPAHTYPPIEGCTGAAQGIISVLWITRATHVKRISEHMSRIGGLDVEKARRANT